MPKTTETGTNKNIWAIQGVCGVFFQTHCGTETQILKKSQSQLLKIVSQQYFYVHNN